MNIKLILDYLEFISGLLLNVQNPINYITYFSVPLFLPEILRKKSKTVSRIFQSSRNILLNKHNYDGLVIKFDKNYYSLVDHESLLIISPRFETWLKPHMNLQQGDCFIDIGSHIGKYTIPLAKQVGENGTVYAFEANEENFKHLQMGIKLNKLENVICVNRAIWNTKTELKFYTGKMSGRHSAKIEGDSYSLIKADTVDNLLNDEDKTVNLIKIDVEGAELEVLEGAEITIKASRPKIVCEVMPENIELVHNYLTKLGYIIEFIGDPKDYAYNILAISQ